ncbi:MULTISPECIES: aminotransferase class I/II-fold pyridoxal phosphate-dependent enzyme [Cysteiniphilum]|uniref:aminotransferase class I/II-fold pyridoxal phosphate-dependent enzyme n=1 Tax=Cysteiniphilum TaxID=2056696 RepID=UPI001CE376EC|nr:MULTISPECIES: aminotransferase class I/II-fold pyridoxal phosphate-dependent enzyme [Cysteiniphilum]
MSFKPYISTEPSIFGKMSVMAKNHNAINFTQGAPDFKTPDWLIDRLNYYVQNGFNQYAPIPGAPSLKHAIAHKVKMCYDVDINPEDNVSISSGAVEAIFALISACIGKGDEVVYFDPAFDAYPSIVNFNQGISRRISLLTDGSIDLQKLAQTINAKTKLIILNSPHNPMGSVITKAQYAEIAKLIKGRDILLLSDEVYEHIYAGDSYTSALQIPELQDQLVVVQSLGKTYNLTGWRLGVCIAPLAIIQMINAMKQFTSFSAPHPMQLALADCINAHPEYWQDLPKLYQAQHHKLVDGLANSRFKVLPWAGSPFQILDYTGISDEDDFSFCQRLIHEHGVGLVPISSLYETPQQGLVRLCFAKYDDVLLEGVKRLCQV